VSKKFGERYQKTNKTNDTNKLTLLAFKIIAILHNTLLATFINLLETVSKGLFRNRSQNRCHAFLDCRHVCKTYGGLLSVSPPEQHHKRRTFCIRGGNPRTCEVVLRSIPKEAFVDTFQKVYERCQQCVVKDGDYFEGQ
jgi:hypothetical protein